MNDVYSSVEPAGPTFVSDSILHPTTGSVSPNFTSQYWDRKRLESARHGRRLGEALSMSEWVLDVREFDIFVVLCRTIKPSHSMQALHKIIWTIRYVHRR